jgi:hypothetical protein
MLNKNGERELAYVVLVDGIEELPGYDRVESACIGGWRCIVPKGQFHVGDPGIYFEIDSRVPSDNPAFAFMEKRNYKVKTQKMCKSISSGLLMHAEDFGWKNGLDADGHALIYDPKDNSRIWYADGEDRFLTKELNVTYADDEDNARKAPSADKYKKMTQRHPNIFKKPWARWMMKREWGRKIMFFFFGKKKDKATGFPTKFPYVKRSDEERVENMPFILKDKEPWVKTQKIDGTSSTYILERKGKHKFEEYVCSRNVRQLTPSQKNYHTDIEGNVYWMMADKYKIFDFLKSYLIENNLDYVCLQGETAGPSLQGNPHKFKEICFFGYNFIRSDTGRMNSIEAAKICNAAGIPWVPIADEAYILPDDMETLKLDADGPCLVGEGPREGWVYRSLDGQRSFKNVSRQYLLKH